MKYITEQENGKRIDKLFYLMGGNVTTRIQLSQPRAAQWFGEEGDSQDTQGPAGLKASSHVYVVLQVSQDGFACRTIVCFTVCAVRYSALEIWVEGRLQAYSLKSGAQERTCNSSHCMGYIGMG